MLARMKWALLAAGVVIAGLVTALVIVMRADDPTPIDCARLCSAEATCKTAKWDRNGCAVACLQLAALRETKPACEPELTEALTCWSSSTRYCGAADACAAAWSEAYRCLCKLPDLPAEMAEHCGVTSPGS
jgi:hypothetical protein